MFMAVKCKLELSRQYQEPQIKKRIFGSGCCFIYSVLFRLSIIRCSAARKVWLRILNWEIALSALPTERALSSDCRSECDQTVWELENM